MLGLAAGNLRERVVIQEANLVDNGRGGRTRPTDQPWTDLGTRLAEVIALRGDEAIRNAIQNSVQTWRVTMRPFPGLSTAHRLLWGSIALDIRSIAPTEARDGVVMTCESGVRKN